MRFYNCTCFCGCKNSHNKGMTAKCDECERGNHE